MALVNAAQNGSGGGGIADAIFQVNKTTTSVGSNFDIDHVSGAAFAFTAGNIMTCAVAGEYVLFAHHWGGGSGNLTLLKNSLVEAVREATSGALIYIAMRVTADVGDSFEFRNTTTRNYFADPFLLEWRKV